LDASTGIAGAARGIVGAALTLSVLACCSGGDKEESLGVVSENCDADRLGERRGWHRTLVNDLHRED